MSSHQGMSYPDAVRQTDKVIAPRRSPHGSRLRRALARAALAGLLLGVPLAAAQATEFAQMQALLDQGYYNSAARLNGPDLVARYPESGRAHFLYARALYLTGDLAGAASELDKVIAIDGDSDPGVVNLQGLLRAANGDPVGALRALQNAFLRGRDYEFAMDWGRVAWQAGRYPEAISAFEAAATTERGRKELWPFVDKGRLLVFTGKLPEAIAAFNAAIDVFEATDPGEARPGSPAYVEAYYRLGEAYEQLGEVDRAEVNYRAARTADPNYGPAIQALDRLSRSFE